MKKKIQQTLEAPAQVLRALIQKWIKGLIYSWTLGLCVTAEWRVR